MQTNLFGQASARYPSPSYPSRLANDILPNCEAPIPRFTLSHTTRLVHTFSSLLLRTWGSPCIGQKQHLNLFYLRRYTCSSSQYTTWRISTSSTRPLLGGLHWPVNICNPGHLTPVSACSMHLSRANAWTAPAGLITRESTADYI